jgi:hypothetical protein
MFNYTNFLCLSFWTKRASASSCRSSSTAFYRGVGTTPEVWPGTIIVLVPLPLFISVPLTGEPGTMTDSDEPEDPVTRPGPREVVIEDGLSDDAVCASATPVITVRVIVAANQKLIMS